MTKGLHHHVYVVELQPSVLENKRFRAANPDCDADSVCLYVGMTGLTPEKRFENHKSGIKAGRGWVRDYGIELRPDLYEELNPMTFEKAQAMESELGRLLRRHRYAVIWA